MKKYIFFAGILLAMILLTNGSRAQQTETHDKKSKEIIIRKNGDKSSKMTIEIDGDSVMINGKPLSDYHGDELSVITRDFMKGHSGHFRFSPDNENMDINVFDNDNDNDNDNDHVFENGFEEPRTFLGVMTEKSADGIKITNVIKGSGAEKAGLQKDDIITRLDDKKISSPEDLVETVRSHKPDDNVKIDYLRNNKKKDVNVKLGETKDKNRPYFFKYNKQNNMNGNGFNFKMPPMPPMPKMPNTFYNYKFWNKGNPKLGVKIEDTENGNGAKILNVEEGSAADKAGLKKDDIITEINGEKVNNVDDVREQLNDMNDKETLAIKAKRNNADMNFDVKISKERNSADL